MKDNSSRKRKKSKKRVRIVSNYLIELSAIVIGVLVSFYIGSAIEKRKAMKDLDFYMVTIKAELEDNKKLIDMHIDYYEHVLKFRNILATTPYKEIPLDSITKYQDYVYSDMNFQTSDYAWDIFKSSGKMDLIPDKSLLLDIMMSYKKMDELRIITEYWLKMKTGLLIKVINLAKDKPSYAFNPEYEEVKDLFDHIRNVVTTGNGEYTISIATQKRLDKLIAAMGKY